MTFSPFERRSTEGLRRDGARRRMRFFTKVALVVGAIGLYRQYRRARREDAAL